MNKFFARSLVALALVVFFAGSAMAQGVVLHRGNAMTKAAESMVNESFEHALKGDAVAAIGLATTALDIARTTGDKDLVVRTEKLLFMYRTLNLMRVSESAAAQSMHASAAPEIKALSCKMAREAGPEFVGLLKKTKRACLPL